MPSVGHPLLWLRKTPQESLRQLSIAAEAGDFEAIRKYVALIDLISEAWDGRIEYELWGDKSPEDFSEEVRSNYEVGGAVMKAMEPAVTGAALKHLVDYCGYSTEESDQDVYDNDLGEALADEYLAETDFRRLLSLTPVVDLKGNTAVAAYKAENGELPFASDVKLQLERRDNHWQVVRIVNIRELMRKFKKLEKDRKETAYQKKVVAWEKELAAVHERNRPVEEAIDAAVKVRGWQKTGDLSGDMFRMYLQFENTGNRDIVSVGVDIVGRFKDRDAKDPFEFTHLPLKLSAGKTGVEWFYEDAGFDIKGPDRVHWQFMKSNPDDITIDVTISLVEFADGTVLECEGYPEKPKRTDW